LEVVLGRPWTLSFGMSQIHGHGSWLVCEVALTITLKSPVTYDVTLQLRVHDHTM
jgi:hypothetical protein